MEMTREDNERQREIRNRIIRTNREGTLEGQYEDAQIRRLIKLEKILKIVFLTPFLIISMFMMGLVIQGFMIWFGWL